MENKNTIIALVLMLVVWVGFSFLFPAQKEVPPPPATEQTRTVEPPPTPEIPATVAPASPPAPSFSTDVELRELVVDTDLYRARFTNVGGRIKALELKKYREEADPESPLIRLIEADEASLETLRTSGFGIDPNARYAISVDDEAVRVSGGESLEIVFSTTNVSGLRIEKVFTFHGGRYDLDLEVRAINEGRDAVQGTSSLSLVQPWKEEMEGSNYEFVGPATFIGEEVKEDKPGDLVEGARSYGEEVVWTAFETKYFMTAAVPLEGSSQQVRIEKTANAVENTLQSSLRTLQVGERAVFPYLLYFGPRDLDVLKEVDHQLAEAIDFGFFGIIARPLLHVLKFFQSFVGNYGVAIILLTVIIKILFWPLTQKSYSSMKAMQKLQPEMQKIRERFKNDRERLNREIMELYKKHRVNPLGGCLPMVVQIPVFFALYKVLLGTIELRQAPFALWITDLSVKDPYYVTPLIMGVTMFLQQKMTPSTMDPKQAKMFMLMPVVFTFLFLNFPSGLVIYWLVNNLLTIAQQTMINRKA